LNDQDRFSLLNGGINVAGLLSSSSSRRNNNEEDFSYKLHADNHDHDKIYDTYSLPGSLTGDNPRDSETIAHPFGLRKLEVIDLNTIGDQAYVEEIDKWSRMRFLKKSRSEEVLKNNATVTQPPFSSLFKSMHISSSNTSSRTSGLTKASSLSDLI
jgi:hypothetical protein